MIKVNLLRNRVGDDGPQTSTRADSSSSSSSDPGAMREVVVKIIFIALGTVALMVYENQRKNELIQRAAELSSQVAQLQTTAQAKAAEAESVKDIEVQAKELEDKLKILKLLSRLRLREVKTLDFMQSSIPEKVWLKGLKFESPKETPETGRFTFEGGAVNTEEISEFVKRLENSAYLADVILIKNQELAQANKGLPIRDFLFTAEVETQN